MKVAIYARVSTEDQQTDTQIQLCRDNCERLGHEVYKLYVDNAISGAKTSRPSFNLMLDDMRTCKFDGIMVSRLDRIGRSLQHLLSLFDEFNNKGVHFISVAENIDTVSASGKLMLHIISAFAEYERNIISERTKEGLRNKTGTRKRGRDKRPRKRRGGLKAPTFYA